METIETRRVDELRPHDKNSGIYNDTADPALIESVFLNGILNSLIITKDNRIISGHRRLDAAKNCSLSEVPVTVFESDDELEIRRAIIHNNISRVKTNEQLGREALELMEIEREFAQQRQAAGVPVNLPEGGSDSRDIVGKYLNISGKTVDRAIKLVDLIDSLEDDDKNDQSAALRKSVNKSFNLGYNHAEREGLFESDTEEQIDDYITLDDWKELSDEDKANALISSKDTVFNKTNDAVEWARWTWNPITGCKNDCEYCFARDRAERFYHKIKGDRFQPVVHPNRFSAPFKTPVPGKQYEDKVDQVGYKTVFTCSMADLFGNWVPREWIEAVLDSIRQNPQWNFILLTSFPKGYEGLDFPPNAWVGVTVTKQSQVKKAEAVFRNIEATVKFLSCEPMLEKLTFEDLTMFDWVIIGGASESKQTGDSKKTPEFKPPRENIAHIEDQASKAGCAVYEKTNLLERIREYPEFIESAISSA